MNKTGFIYDEIFLKHIPPHSHPENEQRLVSIIQTLKKSDIWNELEHIKPSAPEITDIEAVHSPAYIKEIQNAEPGFLDPDTYMCEDSYNAAFYSAGALVKAVEECRARKINNAFCAVRPPGHHAEPGCAMGFCLLNNVAIGARYAQKKDYKKVFIADFDVHHGNGTQNIFYDDDSVFYFSTHQYPHYPGTGSKTETGMNKGKGYTMNLPMSPGAGDVEYKKAYQEILPKIVKEFDPDIFFVSAGYDLYEHDPLSSILVTDDGIKNIVQGIVNSKKNIPYIFTLEGGYNIDTLGKLVLLTIKEVME